MSMLEQPESMVDDGNSDITELTSADSANPCQPQCLIVLMY